MATLNVKNFPAEVHEQIKDRARQDRRSVAQEVIHLLTQALAASPAKGGYDPVGLASEIRESAVAYAPPADEALPSSPGAPLASLPAQEANDPPLHHLRALRAEVQSEVVRKALTDLIERQKLTPMELASDLLGRASGGPDDLSEQTGRKFSQQLGREQSRRSAPPSDES